MEHGDRRILFDAGQGNVLMHNAARLGIAVETADAVVLSHGHYDHTGGLRDVLDAGASPTVFVHPAAFDDHFSRKPDGEARDIGMQRINEETLRERTRVVETKGPTEVAPGVFVTGPIPRETEFEDVGGPFYTDCGCDSPDDLPDDQALFFEADEGVVVVLGCAHAGVVNTLEHVGRLADCTSFHTVMGGMHLVTGSPERIELTIQAFRRFEIANLLPAHCTGFYAMARLWNEFADPFRPVHVGTVVEFGE
jgi:7,8-dihydropterin-6-yl-methyl-4-(beta-D-ribofuranosyl)aminobenzene 5'-phosphate synthase